MLPELRSWRDSNTFPVSCPSISIKVIYVPTLMDQRGHSLEIARRVCAGQMTSQLQEAWAWNGSWTQALKPYLLLLAHAFSLLCLFLASLCQIIKYFLSQAWLGRPWHEVTFNNLPRALLVWELLHKGTFDNKLILLTDSQDIGQTYNTS